VFEDSSLKHSSGDCDPATKGACLKIELEYPVAIGGPKPAVDAVNSVVNDFVKVSLQQPQDAPDASLEEQIEQLVDEHLDLAEGPPSAVLEWEIQSNGEVVLNTEDVVTLRLEYFGYTGGAHANSEVTYKSLELPTGKGLEISDVITDMQQFTALAENEFRKVRKLSPDANYEEAGFWFSDNRFALPDTFGLLRDGIILYYNSYEIAPYSSGPTEIKLSKKQLGDLLSAP
jgi:hypothetical protein